LGGHTARAHTAPRPAIILKMNIDPTTANPTLLPDQEPLPPAPTPKTPILRNTVVGCPARLEDIEGQGACPQHPDGPDGPARPEHPERQLLVGGRKALWAAITAIPAGVPDRKPLPPASTLENPNSRKAEAGGSKERSGHGASPDSPRRSKRPPNFPSYDRPTAGLRPVLPPNTKPLQPTTLTIHIPDP
jgi:hypothetical protein